MRIASLLVALFLAFTACTPFKTTTSSSSSRCQGDECVVVANRFKANNGLLKQSQAFAAIQKCLELPDAAVSDQTKQIFSSVRLNLSAEGLMSDLNAPMIMALTQLAGEMCSDRINLEASGQSQFFAAFDLGAAPASTTVVGQGTDAPKASVQDTVQKLAKSCWGRDPLAFELEKINDLFSNSSASAKKDKSSALFLCALVLSAPDMFIY